MAELYLPFRTAAGSSQEHRRTQTSGRTGRGLQTSLPSTVRRTRPFALGIQSQVQEGAVERLGIASKSWSLQVRGPQNT